VSQKKGYLIASLEIRDPAGFAEYGKAVPAMIAAFGGRYVVRGAKVEHVEGALPIARLVVLEFPSLAELKRFYHSPEYAPLLKLRLETTTSSVLFVEGHEAP
jgi:uncharacterized protein (DUF1330 family)